MEFPGKTIFSLAYVGSRGLYLPLGTVDLNALSLQTIAQYGPALCVDPGTPGCVMVPNTWQAIQPPQNQFYGSDTVPQYLALEQYPQFSNSYGSGVAVNGYPGADSDFSSLQAKVEKHMSHHISSIASFTWGKIMTTIASHRLLRRLPHRRTAGLEKPEPGARSQRAGCEAAIQLADFLRPSDRERARNQPRRSFANSLLGGWTINSIAYLSDGVPIAVPSGTNDPYFNQRVDLKCDPAANAARTPQQWFNYTWFLAANQPVRSRRSPGIPVERPHGRCSSADLSLYKNFALGRERNIRLEIASYNVTNTVQYGYPNVLLEPGRGY